VPHASSLLTTIAISLGVAYVGALVARRLRLPPLIGYLLAGVALGPFTPGFVADPQIAAQLAEIGVALLLFGVGIHFSLSDLVSVWRVAVPGALVQVALAAMLAFAVGHLLFGWPPVAALVLAMAVGVSSTAVATRVLEARGDLQTTAGRIALGWLVVQDLIVILALVLLPSVADSGPGGTALAPALAWQLLEVGGFVAAMLLVGRKLVPRLLEWTALDGSRELFRLAVIVVALGVAYASAELTGVSLALGAFFAGVVVAESDVSHQAAAESVPIQQVFTVLFFVSVGMLFDPGVLVHAPVQVLAIALTILLGIGGVTLLTLLGLRVAPHVAVAVAAALAQVGEFSFIVTGVAAGSGLLPPEGRDLVLAAAILTIVANPLVLRLAQAVGALAERSPRVRQWHHGRTETRARATIPQLSRHVIIVGHGRVGSVVAAALRDEEVPYVVVEQNMALARDVRAEGVPVIYGDAGWPEVLGAARPETARLLIIAIPERGNVRRIVQAAREANPDLPVIVRTHTDSEAEWLKTQAIERIVMSERRTAADIAEYALEALRSDPAEPSDAAAQAIRNRLAKSP
jgi:monovalent cation:H+ antiporter-2, CPA2 family